MDLLVLFALVAAAAFAAAAAVGRAWVLAPVATLVVIALTVALLLQARRGDARDWSDGMLVALGLGMTAISMGAAIVGLLVRGWPRERPEDAPADAPAEPAVDGSAAAE